MREAHARTADSLETGSETRDKTETTVHMYSPTGKSIQVGYCQLLGYNYVFSKTAIEKLETKRFFLHSW